MTKVFRHIGYYNVQEDIQDLFLRSADEIVNAMSAGYGNFHSSNGDCESDITDVEKEHDANMFSKTSDSMHLVRYQRGNKIGDEGWYIDIYKLMEVEDENTSDEDEEVYEYCPYCENEVKLNNEFKVQICPDCGHAIVPCCLCPFDDCKSNCPLDALCRQKNDEIDEEAGIEVTLSSFIELFDKQIPSYQADGYTISAKETEGIRGQKLLFRYDFDYGIYILTNLTYNGQAYTWDKLPSPGSLFDGLWNVTGEEMDSFKVKPNFE